jgi:hypothetical protein
MKARTSAVLAVSRTELQMLTRQMLREPALSVNLNRLAILEGSLVILMLLATWPHDIWNEQSLHSGVEPLTLEIVAICSAGASLFPTSKSLRLSVPQAPESPKHRM